MSDSLQFEALPFAGDRPACSHSSRCGCAACSEAEAEFGLEKIGAALGRAASAFTGKRADDVDGARIVDLTGKADRSQRKGTRNPMSVYALVLHQMACCANRKDPLNNYLKVGSHFAILRDGRILQLHPISALVWASNGFNQRSVAVEFAGNFPNTRGQWWEGAKHGTNQVSPEQIEAGRYLVRWLIKSIGLTHVLAHRQSSGTRENDPGPDIWRHVGQWAVETLGMRDGGPGFKIDTGRAIPEEWRTWSKPISAASPELREEEMEDEFEGGSAHDFELDMERGRTRARSFASNGRPAPSRVGRKQPLRRPAVRRASASAGTACNCPQACPEHGTEHGRWVQQSLNQLQGLRLPITGVMDAATRSAVRSFQEQRGLPVDGIAGPETERGLMDAKSSRPAADDAGEIASLELEEEFRDGAKLDLTLGEGPVAFEASGLIKGAGRAGAIGAAIEGVSLLRDYLSTGGVKLDAYDGQHAPHPHPPGIKPVTCVRWMRLATFDPTGLGKANRGDSFLFKIESEYDGRNLHSVRVYPQVRGTSKLSKSTFEAHFAEQLILSKDKRIAGIRLHIRGSYERWHPFLNDDSGFQGALEIWADGSSALSLTSDDNRVRRDPLTPPICPILRPPVQLPKLPTVSVATYELTVFFTPGRSTLRPGDADKIVRWFRGQNPVDKADPKIKSLPAAIRKKIEVNELKIFLEGYSSTTQGSEKNQALSLARVRSVKKILQSLTGLPDDSFKEKALGEFAAKTKDAIEDAKERRVKISVIDAQVR